MTGISFGDLAQAYTTKSRIGGLKSDSIRLANELASGKKTDIAASLSGDTSGLAALERSRQMLDGFISAAGGAAVKAQTQQAALSSISAELEGLSEAFSTLSQDSDGTQGQRVADRAKTAFASAFSTLNTKVAGQAIFAGMALNGPALAPPETVLDALETLVSGAQTAEDISARVTAWFDSPTGFASVAYVGAAAAPGLRIDAEGTSVDDQTAASAQIRKALAGLAVASFIDHPNLSTSGADRMALRDHTIDALQSGMTALVDLSARIGMDEARIETAISHQQAASLTQELTISNLISSDPAQTAVELEAVRTNLEAVYAVTARLSDLTLTRYLR